MKKFRENEVERRLTAAQHRALVETLDAAEREQRIAQEGAAAFRLLASTGLRLSEVLCLQWRDVNFGRGVLVVRDTKTGPRSIAISEHSLSILDGLRGQVRRRSIGWVFPRPGREGERISSDWLWCRWRWIRREAKLDEFRIHDLRHALASVAAESGLTFLMIGKLLGHRCARTTARYAHLVDEDVLRAAAAQVSEATRVR